MNWLFAEGSREYEVFNGNFMTAWKGTHNFRVWVASGPYNSLMELTPGHPHAGHLSMTDMRIRLSQYVLYFLFYVQIGKVMIDGSVYIRRLWKDQYTRLVNIKFLWIRRDDLFGDFEGLSLSTLGQTGFLMIILNCASPFIVLKRDGRSHWGKRQEKLLTSI